MSKKENLPIPAGATADAWNSQTFDGVRVRALEWSRRTAAGIVVAVDGWQYETGAVASHVSLYGVEAGRELTAGDARRLAAALLAAAVDLEAVQR